MSTKVIVTAKATLNGLKGYVINWLLGPAARAGQIVADADARIIGLFPRPLPSRPHTQRPFFNQLQAISSA